MFQVISIRAIYEFLRCVVSKQKFEKEIYDVVVLVRERCRNIHIAAAFIAVIRLSDETFFSILLHFEFFKANKISIM